jgi:plastocyanin
MRKLVGVLLAAFLLAPAGVSAHASSGSPALADAQLFAGAGTPLSNGTFFPGTAVNDGTKFQAPAPLMITKGQNVQFTNLDVAVLTNAHRIRSFKSKKNGYPLFISETVFGPGQTLMITSHLKPKDEPYFYFCTVHTTMYGAIQVTK